MNSKTASLYLLVLLAVLQAVMAAILQNKQHNKSKRDRMLHVLMSPKLGYKLSTKKFEVPQNAKMPRKQTKELTATDLEYEQEVTATDLKYEQELIATDLKYVQGLIATDVKYEQPNEMPPTPMAAEFDYSKQTNVTYEFPPRPNQCKKCDYPYACSIGHIIGNCVPYGFGCRSFAYCTSKAEVYDVVDESDEFEYCKPEGCSALRSKQTRCVPYQRDTEDELKSRLQP